MPNFSAPNFSIPNLAFAYSNQSLCRFGDMCRNAVCPWHHPNNSGQPNVTHGRKGATDCPSHSAHQRQQVHQPKGNRHLAGKRTRNQPTRNRAAPHTAVGAPEGHTAAHRGATQNEHHSNHQRRRTPNTLSATSPPPPPPPSMFGIENKDALMPDCGVHYLWFAFVCFLIRSHPPPSMRCLQTPQHRGLHPACRGWPATGLAAVSFVVLVSPAPCRILHAPLLGGGAARPGPRMQTAPGPPVPPRPFFGGGSPTAIMGCPLGRSWPAVRTVALRHRATK